MYIKKKTLCNTMNNNFNIQEEKQKQKDINVCKMEKKSDFHLKISKIVVVFVVGVVVFGKSQMKFL